MEDTASGINRPLLAKLRALARRGALLSRQEGGAGLIQRGQGEPAAKMTPDEMLRALDRGWLKSSGAEQFILSKRGTTMLRVALNRAAATAATASVAQSSVHADTGRVTLDFSERAISSDPGRVHVNASESPLAWLHQRRDKDGKPLLSQVEFDAGERLRADFDTAQMTPRVTASWDISSPGGRQQRGVPGAGMDVTEAVVAARQRVERAMLAVGPNLSGVLIDVCCLLIGLEQAERNGGWPKRAGKVVLQIALDALARHYGLIAPVSSGKPSRQHWGAADFRPTIRGGSQP